MDGGKVKLSSEGAQAVREVAGKANVTQGDRYPEHYVYKVVRRYPFRCR
jgi:hypothetical protein